MPDDVYLTLEANAAVTQASRSRRVLIIGVPLLHILSERELRGVIAHEFGHYSGGDTKLGPWIFRTRETIIRTVQQLSDDGRRRGLDPEARPAAVHLVRQGVPADHGEDLAPAGVRRGPPRRRQRSGAPPTPPASSASTRTARRSTPTGAARSPRCSIAGIDRRSRTASAASSRTRTSRKPRTRTSSGCATRRPTRTTRIRRCPSGSRRSRACRPASRTTRRARSSCSETRPAWSAATAVPVRRGVEQLSPIEWDAVGAVVYGARARELTQGSAR